MRRRKQNFYSSYRGGKRPSSQKGLIVALSLVFLLSAAIAAAVLLPDLLVFNSEGFHFNFGKKTEDADPKAPDDGAEPVIIIDGEGDPSSGDTGTGSFDLPMLSGLECDIASVTDKTYTDELMNRAVQQGANALVFSVKANDGILHIPVTSQYAPASALSPEAEGNKQALKALSGKDIYLIARVSVCCDNIAPRSFLSASLRTSGTTWLDYDYTSWLNPYSEITAQYLLDILTACQEAGFDQVVLENASFPVRGKVDLIEYSAEDGLVPLSVAVTGLIEEASEKAAELDISIALVCTENAAESAKSGQNLSQLAPFLHSIYFSKGAELSVLTTSLAGTECYPGVFGEAASSKDICTITQ